MTLTEFLLARIAEDEEWAPTRHTLLCLRTGCETCIFDDDEDAIAAERVCTCGYSQRVLAECEAKRRIVEAVCIPGREVREQVAPGRFNVRRPLVPLDEMGGDLILPLMAAVYADHPDYDEAWRP